MAIIHPGTKGQPWGHLHPSRNKPTVLSGGELPAAELSGGELPIGDGLGGDIPAGVLSGVDLSSG